MDYRTDQSESNYSVTEFRNTADLEKTLLTGKPIEFKLSLSWKTTGQTKTVFLETH